MLMLLSCCFFHTKAQTEQELTGLLMFANSCNNQEYPVSHVFDNDPGTYVASCPLFGSWIGLDLGKKHIITKIAYCPGMDDNTESESGYDKSLQLGIFEGADNPDFGDAIPLHIIPGPTEYGLTEQPVLCTRGVRYVRFVFPRAIDKSKSSYMAELKFYGYEGTGDDARLPLLTNLPVVSIHTENNQEIDKDEYIKGVISVIYDGGTKIHTDSLEIRGRGNNSWTYPKKPYRIKLFEETHLLDLPANAQNWTLINNYGDKTLMRNMLAFDFSRRIEMPYTSPAEAVDVVLNGDYVGCYQLCDHVDVHENRVDIEELSPADVSGENLTGGYLIEIDAYYYQEPVTFMSSRYNIPVAIKYPDNKDIVGSQVIYIEKHFNKLVEAVYDDDNLREDPENGFRKYLHTDIFLKYFLIGEYSGNTDTYWSVRLYKKRGDDKFHFAPVWDFDLAFENDRRTYPINEKMEWIALSSHSSVAGGARDFVHRIMSDSDMKLRLKEIYDYYREQNIISKDTLLKVVDDYAARLEQSQDLNFKRWPILNEIVHSNPVIHGSYAAEVENVRKYVSERLDWINWKLNCDSNSKTEIADGNDRIKLEMGKGLICIKGVDEPLVVRIADISGRIIFDRLITEYSTTIAADRGIYIVTLNDSSTQKRTYKAIVP
jgi:hypothetical protein